MRVCVSVQAPIKDIAKREKWPSTSPDPSLTCTLSINWLRQSKQEIEKAAREEMCVHVCLWVGGTQQEGGQGLAGMPKMNEINGLILQNVRSLPKKLLLAILSFWFSVHFSILSLPWPWSVGSSYRTAVSVEITSVCRYRVTLIAASLSDCMTARSMDAITICRAKYVQLAVSHSLKDTLLKQRQQGIHDW